MLRRQTATRQRWVCLIAVSLIWCALPTIHSHAADQVAKQPAAGSQTPPLNILILYADDWRHDTLGCAGHPLLKTPHLDQLAREGVRFTQNAVTTSICGVSRASLLTGQWMSRHGNRAFDMFQTPWAETFPGLLREHGYWVGHVGKWHNGPFPAARYDFGRAYAGTHWMQDEQGQRIHVTARNLRDALAFLKERPAEKPFCLTVSFFATHAEDANPEQYLPQPGSMSLFANDVVPVPKTATDDHFRRLPPFLANEHQEGRKRWHWRFDTPEKYQRYMKNYLRLASEVDTACGEILSRLEEQRLQSRTLVIFTTDNGYFHGEHGLADKWYPFEESIRVPLILRDPRIPVEQRGSVNTACTLNVDLAPTILAAAQLTAPPRMQGRNLAELYLPAFREKLSRDPWRTEFFYEHATLRSNDFIPASEALVRRDWKYLYWPPFEREQLFHLAVDPGEEQDLVSEPAAQAVLKEMRERFGVLKATAK